MKIFLLAIHIVLVIISTVLSVGYFKLNQKGIATLWAMAIFLWLINVATDIVLIS